MVTMSSWVEAEEARAGQAGAAGGVDAMAGASAVAQGGGATPPLATGQLEAGLSRAHDGP